MKREKLTKTPSSLKFCFVQLVFITSFAHLTNHQVQKDAPEYESTGIPDNQWSRSEFVQHLEENHGKGTWERVIAPNMEQAIVSTLLLWDSNGHRPKSFEFLGFDILLDADFHPWVLEVNRGPGLHLLTDVVKVHHPAFVHDAFEVLLPTFNDSETSPPSRTISVGDFVGNLKRIH